MTEELRYDDERPAPNAAPSLLLWALCLVAAAGSAVLLAGAPASGENDAPPAALAVAPGVASSPAVATRRVPSSPPDRSQATAPVPADELHAEGAGATGRAH